MFSGREVKELNKPYDLKTHFVGVIDLCSTETHFPDLVLKLINRTCDELKDSSSKKSHKNEMVVSADQRYLLQGNMIWIILSDEYRSFSGKYFRGRKIFSTISAIVTFFSQPFHESFKFLKTCPYNFYKV